MPRSRWFGFVGVVVALLAGPVLPAAAADADPDPLGILTGRGITEQVGLGVDTVTVNICSSGVPGVDVYSFTMGEMVDFLNDEVAPHFSLISGGRYEVAFVAGTEFTAARIGTAMDDTECSSVSKEMSSTSNSVVVTRAAAGGGFGSSGLIGFDGQDVSAGDLSTPSSASLRGFLVRGGSSDLPATFAHELGHTLYWPHSGSTADGGLSDYDNVMDLMSGGGFVPLSSEWDNFCTFGTVSKGDCEIIHTPAINRYASGWIDADRVELLLRPGGTHELVGPEVTTGTAMVLMPTADPDVYLTIDARPATGFDAVLPVSGVTVHQVDLGAACPSILPCIGTNRRQQPAVPAIDDAAHVIQVGEAQTLHGVTIEVAAATADGFEVSFTGVPEGCGLGVNPFTDVTSASFAYGSVSCIRLLEITTGTSPTTYSPAADVTREQMAAFIGRLWRALGESCASPATPFTDVAATSFAVADIACIFDLGVTTGTSPTTYAPAGSVTREQMAAFLARLWRAAGNTCASDPTPFTDVAATSFAVADIACIFHLGITTGTSPTTYAPADPVTREQMAAFLERFWLAAISV